MAWLGKPLPVADFSPDMPAFENPGSGLVMNVLPRTPQSYGPMSSLSAFGGALNNQCQGAFSCQDSGGNQYVFAGDSTNLYDYTAASTTPNIISNGTNPYNCTSIANWNFCLFGQRVLATDFSDPIQSYILQSSSTFTPLANGGITALTLVAGSGYTPGTYALSVSNAGGGVSFAGTVTVNSAGHLASYTITNTGSLYPQTATISVPAGAGSGTGGSITPTIATIAPQCRYMDIAKQFLICGNTYDPTGGNQPQRVWWSALNDPTNWPTPGTSTAAQYQSSYNDLFGDGGWITGIVGNLGGCDAAVFMEHEVWRMIYAGPPGVFDFFPAEGVRGTHCPNSIIHLGPYVYYLGEDGFYVFDGTSSKSIGANRVDKYFFNIFNQTYLNSVWGAADPSNKIVFWVFPSTSATANVPDTYLAYNWQIDKWSTGNITTETIFRSSTFGYTLDTLSGTLDSYTLPLDSRVFTGGNVILSGFNASHKLSYFNGSALQATIDTTEIAPFDKDIALVTDARPLVDGGSPTVAIATRNRLIDTAVYGSAAAINNRGSCPSMANGRYIRAETVIPAGATWTHFQGVELDATPNGEI